MIALTLTTVLLTAIPQWHSSACSAESVTLRGRSQHVHLCGDPHGSPVIVASGDGGWIHLAPHVAGVLAGQGYFVVGFDAKAYLSSFTESSGALTTADVAGDFAALIDFAARGRSPRPILIGVSEGAALAVVAGANPDVKHRIAGVVTLGLGEVNELAWRWRDSIIYLTKRVPDEPSFRTSDFIQRVSPLPLAIIQSTVDEYVPHAEAARLAALAKQPKQFWTIAASDHAFTDNRPELDARVFEALKWMAAATAASF